MKKITNELKNELYDCTANICFGHGGFNASYEETRID